uniref:Uncharacterized protein n=1 Tax=Oryza punctata TaxID=4537 RepID=A0A0E0MLW1_ORYPU
MHLGRSAARAVDRTEWPQQRLGVDSAAVVCFLPASPPLTAEAHVKWWAPHRHRVWHRHHHIGSMCGCLLVSMPPAASNCAHQHRAVIAAVDPHRALRI